MSMNGFFRAFTQAEIAAMKNDNALIDKWVWEENKFAESTDVETAWNVLASVLDGVGFYIGEEVYEALSNGCSLISAEQVKEQAQKLSQWTPEQVWAKVQALDESEDIYHLEIYQDDEEMLLDQFDKLVAFYQTAAEKNLGAVFYLA